MALNGHQAEPRFMSAFGGKADIGGSGDLCPLMTQSGHNRQHNLAINWLKNSRSPRPGPHGGNKMPWRGT